MSLKKTKERKAERGRAKVFSPPPAPAFGPSRIQKQSRAHIRTLILGRTSFYSTTDWLTTLALPSVLFVSFFGASWEQSENERKSVLNRAAPTVDPAADRSGSLYTNLLCCFFCSVCTSSFLFMKKVRVCLIHSRHQNFFRSIRNQSDWTKFQILTDEN